MADKLTKQEGAFDLPSDLVKMLEEMSLELGESTRDVLIAAVEHFSKIPEMQRKAAMTGAARRRRGA